MDLPEHVNERIGVIAHLHGRDEQRVTAHQRGIEWITGAVGQPNAVYATLAFVVVWIVGNLALPRLGLAAADPPPFHFLHLGLTVGATLIALVVLVTQDRQVRAMEKRSHLDLQINLQSEAKIAKVIALLEELRRDLPDVRNRDDSEAHAMAAPTDAHVVSEALERSLRGDMA